MTEIYVYSKAAERLGLAIQVWPLTSDDHNFFFQAQFLVFLESLESPLSLDSRHIPFEDSG